MNHAVLAALAGALLLSACDNANEQSQADPPPAGQEDTSSDASTRAGDALKDAGSSALDAAAKLGEAGKAAFEAVQEQAPAVTEKLGEAAQSAKNVAGEAGQRLQSAADALMNDGTADAPPLDAEGDSENDANEVPETQEAPAR